MLLSLTAVSYWPVARNDFINYDDSDYVVENEYANAGLTLHNIYTAFTAPRAANWHPLTWISHMVDCELFKLSPAGHHLMSLSLHAANGIILYLVLLRMTAAVWPSAAVAALFAIHPLHVESVAWVAERKDVLSTFFGLIALWTWLSYVTRPGVGRYLIVLAWYAVSLMSKSMLVTMPCLLLLLDWWPLRRVGGEDECDGDKDTPTRCAGAPNGDGGTNLSPRHRSYAIPLLLLEKLPFALLAAVSCAITLYVQWTGHAVASLTERPIVARLATVALAYVGYLEKLVVPTGLAPIYPLPTKPDYPAAIACGLFLVLVTILLLWRSRRRKYLAVGWLWYLGLLVPVIGIVHVGQQSMADRYTYLPAVGIFILLAWAAADAIARWPRLRAPVAAFTAAALAACCLLTNAQVRLWASTKTLFAHTVAVTKDNPVALTNLGWAAIKAERYADAERYLIEALRLDAAERDAWGNLATLYRKQKNYDAALKAYGKVDALSPNNPKCFYQVADLAEERGDHVQAEVFLRKALAVEPQSLLYHHRLAVVLQAEAKYQDAIKEYEFMLANRPGDTSVRNNLAWILATSPDAAARNGARAIELLLPAAAKADCDATLLDTLAAGYAEAGQFDRAIETEDKAIAKARSHTMPPEAVADMQDRLGLYKWHQPYRVK